MRTLLAFGPQTVELSIRQIAERTGIPRSTIHSIGATLCDAGLLEALPGGRYRLGPALVGLGGQVIARTGLVSASEWVLPSLARSTGGEAHLGQLVGGWVVYLARIPTGQPIPMRNRVGLRAPAHLTGCGKAALSQLSPGHVHSLVRSVCEGDGLPLPNLPTLERELERCRSQGYVVNTSFQAGRASVGAAVFDGTGAVVGGVSVASLSSMFTAPVVRRVAEQVRLAADVISTRLGSSKESGESRSRLSTSSHG